MNSKRKNRGPARTQRTRSITAEGVYSNPHFMHTATAQIGNIVRLKTANGIVWEGIFKTFSSNFEVVLEVAARVSNPENPNSSILPATVVDKLIFKPRDILHIVAKDVDLEYPTRDTFQTDTAISARLNGANREEKELEPWDGELNGSDTPLELDSAANGWDANDMFRKNEQDYGVTSTFDHSLRGYTVPLQATDTADYKEAEAKANQIASEIENQPNHKARLELENGDEETLYAAVVRPNEANGKYIPPARRKNQNSGKLARSTPPPTLSQGSAMLTPPSSANTSTSSSSGSTNMHQATPSPKGVVPQAVPITYTPNVVVSNNVVNVPPQMLHMSQQSQIPVSPQAQMPPQIQPQMPVVQNQQQGHHPRHSHTPPHGYGGQQRQGGPQKGQHMNGEVKQMQRGQRNVYQSAPPPLPPQTQQPPPHQGSPYQGGDLPPKIAEMNHGRHHRDEVKELQQFSQDFQMAPPQMVPKEVPSQQQVPPQGPPPQVMMEPQVVPQHIQQQQQQQQRPLSKSPPETSPQPSISPQQDGLDKVTSALKKSTLNPNAKEFVLNPTAKPFQPRSPSTPSLSRPHTPQTPSHSPYISTAMNGPMGQPPTSVIMPMGYMMTSQPQYPQQPQGNRIRKIPMRTDVASQMQVAAATGQPLLAPAPIQPFVYQPGLNPQAYHQMHAVRMYDAPPQLQYLPPNPAQATSPAQPPPYSQGQPPQAPPQQYQAAPPPQGGVQTPQYLPMCNLIPAQPHMMQGMQYIPQGPPPQHPIPLILHNQQHQVHQGPA